MRMGSEKRENSGFKDPPVCCVLCVVCVVLCVSASE